MHPMRSMTLQRQLAMRKLTDNFNNADMRNICTEAGMFAIRAERDYVVEEDFMKAARCLALTDFIDEHIRSF